MLFPLPGGRPLDAAGERSQREAALAHGKCLPRGPGCAACHRPSGAHPFAGWGYPPERVTRLANLESFLFLPPEQRWFFPAFR
jgi:mono/diheme cytochrome c family protein